MVLYHVILRLQRRICIPSKSKKTKTRGVEKVKTKMQGGGPFGALPQISVYS